MVNNVIDKSEYKTRRGNIIMRPSTWKAISKILAVNGMSFNNLVSELLEDYAQKNVESINYYNQKYGDKN